MLDDPVFRLFLATLLGAAIGWERFVDHKPAGLRTHTLVCVGSAAFVLASERALAAAGGNPASRATNARIQPCAECCIGRSSGQGGRFRRAGCA